MSNSGCIEHSERLARLEQAIVDMKDDIKNLSRVPAQLSAMDQRLDEGNRRFDRVENKVDELNHARRKGATAGAGTGTIAGVVSAGVLVWLKSRLG